jgi:hypothetical protein
MTSISHKPLQSSSSRTWWFKIQKVFEAGEAKATVQEQGTLYAVVDQLTKDSTRQVELLPRTTLPVCLEAHEA